MKFYIVNPNAEPLSCFLRNNLVTKNQLRFRRRDFMFFNTQKEAQITLDDIIENCKQPLQAKKLRILEF